VHSLVVGHLDSFQFVAFMNKSAVDILVHVVVYRDVSIFLGEIFAGSYGKYKFSVVRNCQAVFQSDYSILLVPYPLLY
jgi:hypothetical protein